jgi:hypothetical protein
MSLGTVILSNGETFIVPNPVSITHFNQHFTMYHNIYLQINVMIQHASKYTISDFINMVLERNASNIIVFNNDFKTIGSEHIYVTGFGLSRIKTCSIIKSRSGTLTNYQLEILDEDREMQISHIHFFKVYNFEEKYFVNLFQFKFLPIGFFPDDVYMFGTKEPMRYLNFSVAK